MTCEVCGASVIQGHCYDCYVDSEKEIERLRDIWVDGPDSEAARAAQGDFVRRTAGCLCQWEEGDSPCPVHGDTPDGSCPDLPQRRQEVRSSRTEGYVEVTVIPDSVAARDLVRRLDFLESDPEADALVEEIMRRKQADWDLVPIDGMAGLEHDLNEALRDCEGPPGDDGDDVPF
jgi:hypothetical protein